jgi:hypothetical protein
LRRALEDAGFTEVRIEPGAPELPSDGGFSGLTSRMVRLALFHAARQLPGGVHVPLCFNLQAYARRPQP